MADYHLSDGAQSTRIKETAHFGQVIAKIRRDGFDPDYLQHAADFNLTHPDSFQTLNDIEKQR